MTPILMKSLAPRGPWVGLALAVLITVTALTACTQSEDAIVIDNPSADSVTFWPPTLKYARQSDTLYLLINGLKRQASCAVPLQVGWNFQSQHKN